MFALVLGLGRPAAAGSRPYPAGFDPGQVPASLSAGTVAEAASPAALPLPFSDNVEGGTNGWTTTGFWHRIVNPQAIRVAEKIRTDLVQMPDSGFLPKAYSGTACWWFGEDATGTFIGADYDDHQANNSGGTSTGIKSGELVSPLISLTGVSQASLSFYTWWEIEGVDVQSYDLMFVEVSKDGGNTWVNLGRLNPIDDANTASYIPYSTNGVNQTGQWGRVYFNLMPFIGSQIKVRFRFTTGDALFNGFRGWFIDNIGISATPLPPLSVTSVKPAIASPGQLINIVGSGFVNGATTVKIGDLTAEAAVIFHNKIIAYVPDLPSGTYAVTVANSGGISSSLTNSLTVSTAAPPSITSVTPNLIDCSNSGVSQFTINGSNFQPGATLKLGNASLFGVTYVSTTQVKANRPASVAVGTHNLTVTNPDGLSFTKFGAIEIYGGGKITGKTYVEGTTQTLDSTEITFVGPVKGKVYASDSGNYVIDGLIDGTYSLTAKKPNYSPKTVSAAISSCGSAVRHIYLSEAPGASLAGKVTDAANGMAVSGANVKLFPGGESRSTDAEGNYLFLGLDPGTYSLTVSKNGYLSETLGAVSLAADTPNTVNVSLHKDTILKGRVTDASTSVPLSGATVKLSPGGATQVTNAYGNYAFPGLAAGTYSLTASKAGYTSKTVNNVAVAAGTTKQINIPLNINPFGRITGKVVNAMTGAAISGVTVKIIPGGATRTTAADGSFTFGKLTPGSYTLKAAKTGFISYSLSCNVTAGSSTSVQAPLPPASTSIKYRIVLTWGAEPANLDAHLWVPGGSGYYHLAYNNTGSREAYPFAKMNLIDKTGYGPETITIYKNQAGNYQYWVFNRSAEVSPTAKDLTSSDATVKLYNGTTLLGSFTVPPSPSGNKAWHVFDLNPQTGSIIIYNSLAPALPSLSPPASASGVGGAESSNNN
jgi:hypothetical protein